MFLYTHCVLTPAGTTEGFASLKERKKKTRLSELMLPYNCNPFLKVVR